jgi:glycosyltransferase involved in cell wall biosynthesis
LKVLVLTTTFPRWENDTVPAFVYQLSESLQKNGLEIVVLAPHDGNAKQFEETTSGMKIYRFPYFIPHKYQKLANGAGILPNIKKSFLAKLQIPILFIVEAFYAFWLVRKEAIDVVHTHWMVPSGLIGATISRFVHKRHILTEHTAGITALDYFPFKEKFAQYILNNCEKCTVVSTHVYNRLLDLIPTQERAKIEQKIEIIPMGVTTSKYDSRTDINALKAKYGIQEQNVLLFIGRVAEKKGLAYLISAMPKILEKHPNTILIVIGNGPLRSDIENTVEKENLSPHIVFAGTVSEQEKIAYLHLADILVVPSIVTDQGDTEGMPVVIMEGLAAGKPIVASDVGGVRDTIIDGTNGILVEEKNPDQLSMRVIELLVNHELRVKLAGNAVRYAKRFDWETIGQRHSDLITGPNGSG